MHPTLEYLVALVGFCMFFSTTVVCGAGILIVASISYFASFGMMFITGCAFIMSYNYFQMLLGHSRKEAIL